MLLNTIYEHSIDKQDWNGILNIVSDVKYHLMFDCQYAMYVTNFKAFYILLNTLKETP